MTGRERTAWHEAGHAVVADSFGWKVAGLDICEEGGGTCYLVSQPGVSLENIGDHLAQLLAGRLAEVMANEENPREERWHRVLADQVLNLEAGRTPGRGTGLTFRDWVALVADLRRETEHDAERWLLAELERARSRAFQILAKRWRVVSDLARELFESGELSHVGLAPTLAPSRFRSL